MNWYGQIESRKGQYSIRFSIQSGVGRQMCERGRCVVGNSYEIIIL